MRKGLAFLTAFLIALAALAGCEKGAAVRNPRLEKVGPFSATLAWETDVPCVFRINFGEGTLLDRELIEKQNDTFHKVTLTGLKPSTKYNYRIEPGGQAASFRSAPGTDGAFDLVVLDEKSPLCGGVKKSLTADPDLVVPTTPCKGTLANRPENIPTISIPQKGAISLVYGRSLILIAPTLEDALSFKPENDKSNLRRIIVLPKIPDPLPADLADGLIVSGREAVVGKQRIAWADDETAWFEVDAFEIAWVDREKGNKQRRVLVEAPSETKKSCLYCDRLLEAGRYEESLGWYRDFILGNQDRHALEDAYFTIARLEDEKLFQYGDAIKDYALFLVTYPKSRRATLAKYRLDYLKAHADNDYRPLELFERAKATFTRTDPMPTVTTVEKMLEQYPDAAVAQEALFWIGHALENEHPKIAIEYYNRLLTRFPLSEEAAMGAMAIGDIFYRETSNRKALTAYKKAQTIVPDTFKLSIMDKIRKSHRNIKREIARYLAWAVLGLWLVLTVRWKGIPSGQDIWAGAILLSVYAFSGGIYFAVTYEKSSALLLTLTALVVAMSLVAVWNRALSKQNEKPPWIVMTHAFTCSAAVTFLVMYSFHQLYIFGI